MGRTDRVRIKGSARKAAAEGFVARSRGNALECTIHALLVATIGTNVAYLGALLLPGAPATVLIDTLLSPVSQWLPLLVFWLVAARTAFKRWEVILAAVGMTFNVAGETAYVLAMDASGYLASPSFADIGYLLYYPLTAAALIVLVRRQSRRVTGSVYFDATLAALGASAVLALVLAPVFEDATADASVVEGVVAALYPLFDLILIALVVAISASPVLRMGSRWQYLVASLLLFAGADIIYALLIHSDAYSAGTPLDAMWSAGVACAALWVHGVTRSRPAPRSASRSRRTLPVPALAVLAGLAVLLIATQAPVPALALVLAAATVALSAIPVMFRQATLARLVEGKEEVVARLTALDKSKSEIIGTVSHEMRTPLTSILGFVGFVLDGDAGPVPDEAKEMLRVAHRNARRLENMVSNMLVMSQLEVDGEASAGAPFMLDRTLERVVESIHPFAESRDVSITIDCVESASMEGNESHIERVFTNIIENAVKFSPAGGVVRVEASLHPAPAGQPAVRVTVSDDGIGIPADELPHIFDRFFRASNARENAVAGTGLGLAIAREIVRAHRGEISAKSSRGEGASVSVTLPLTHAHEPPRPRADTPA